MSAVTTYYCDICGTKCEQRSEMSPMLIRTTCNAQNPMGDHGGNYIKSEFDAKEVCDTCQRHISEACAKAISRRKEVKRFKTE
jgi:hypothetical protein